MDNKIIAIAAVLIIAAAGAGVYIMISDGGDDGPSQVFLGDYKPNTAGETFVDAAGRTVTVPDQMGHGIITIGSSGPLRFVSMFDMYDYVIEVDKGDVTDNKNGRAYSYAYDYDKVGSYHADNAIDSRLVETIGKKMPSLVVIQYNIYTSNVELCEQLTKVTTVVVLAAQDMKSMGSVSGGLDKYMVDNITMLGTVFGKEDRSTELINGIETIFKDLDNLSRTSDTSVYVAGVTISGSNTLNTTFPTYMPFTLTGIKNAYDRGSTENKVVLNVETISTMDIDMVVIDPSSSDKIKEQESQRFLTYVYSVNNDGDESNDIPMYITVPIVWDSINYDCALASAYCLTSLVYGTLTTAEVEERINGIFTLFYGENGEDVFDDMKEFFAGKSASNGVEFPILGEVKVVKNGESYSIEAA